MKSDRSGTQRKAVTTQTLTRVTIRDVANHVGVSPTTVSRILNNKRRFPEETVERVWAAVESLGYRPDPVAQTLKGARTHAVGCLVRLSNDVFVETVNAIEKTLADANYSLFVCQPSDVLSSETQLERLVDRRVDGLFLAGTFARRDQVEAWDRSLPVIQIGQISSPDVDSIRIDNIAGAMMAVEHLLERGCRNIAYFDIGSHMVSGRDRLRGYRAALEKHGVPVREELIRSDPAGDRNVVGLMEDGVVFDAIFAGANVLALQALQMLHELKIDVPGQVKLLGFGDLKTAHLLNPPLTLVSQRNSEIGRVAALRFLERLDLDDRPDPIECLVQPELIVRSST